MDVYITKELIKIYVKVLAEFFFLTVLKLHFSHLSIIFRQALF